MKPFSFLTAFVGGFNSIMVQLELAVDARNTERSMSQFHKGSIRTLDLLVSLYA